MHNPDNNTNGQVPSSAPAAGAPQESPMHVDVDAPSATPIPDPEPMQVPHQSAPAVTPVTQPEAAAQPSPVSTPVQSGYQAQPAIPHPVPGVTNLPPQARPVDAPVAQSHAYQQPQPVQTPPTPPTPPMATASAAPASEPKKGNGGMIALIVIAVLLVIALGGWLVASITGSLVPAMDKIDDSAYEAGEKVAEVIDAPNQDLDKNLANVVAETAMPSVVTIYTYATPERSSYYYGDMFDMFFGGRGNSDTQDVIEEEEMEPVMTGLGSGVIIRDDGYIITNNHVVDGADKLMVNVGDESFEGTLVGTDPTSDIAVVKIEPGDTKLQKIEVADSDDLFIGDWVMALGAPLGYEQSATTGIISALGRDSVMDDGNGGTTIYADMIQTDAAINSGNSGGALVDDEAKLVGINTLVAASGTGTGQADNLGFAIPSNYAIAIANQLIDNGGQAAHAKLGVSLTPDDDAAGAVVAEVVEGGAAAEAGIQAGDVIVAVNGESTDTPEDVIFDIRASQPGEKVTVTVERNGAEQDIQVTLGSDSDDQAQQAQNEKSDDASSGLRIRPMK